MMSCWLHSCPLDCLDPSGRWPQLLQGGTAALDRPVMLWNRLMLTSLKLRCRRWPFNYTRQSLEENLTTTQIFHIRLFFAKHKTFFTDIYLTFSLCSAVRRWRACRARCLRRRSCVPWWRDVSWRTRWHGGGFTPSWWRTTGWFRKWVPHWQSPGPTALNCSPVSLLMETAALIPTWRIKGKAILVLKVS